MDGKERKQCQQFREERNNDCDKDKEVFIMNVGR